MTARRKGPTGETPEQAIQRAVREAVLTHARLGRSVVGWKDGKVVWFTPEEVFALSKTWGKGKTVTSSPAPDPPVDPQPAAQ
jgi:hypothetical protein